MSIKNIKKTTDGDYKHYEMTINDYTAYATMDADGLLEVRAYSPNKYENDVTFRRDDGWNVWTSRHGFLAPDELDKLIKGYEAAREVTKWVEIACIG